MIFGKRPEEADSCLVIEHEHGAEFFFRWGGDFDDTSSAHVAPQLTAAGEASAALDLLAKSTAAMRRTAFHRR